MDRSADGAAARRKRLTVVPGGADADPHDEDRAARALVRARFRLWNDPPTKPVVRDRDDHISGGSGVDDLPRLA